MSRGVAFVHFEAEGVGDFVFDGVEAALVSLIHDAGEDGVFGPRFFVPTVFAGDLFAAPEVVVFVASFELAGFEFGEVGDTAFDVSDDADPDAVIALHEDVALDFVAGAAVDSEGAVAGLVEDVFDDFAAGVVVIEHDAGAGHESVGGHDVVDEVVLDAGAVAPEFRAGVDGGSVAFFEADVEEFVLRDEVVISTEDEGLAGEIMHEVIAEDIAGSAETDGGSDTGEFIEVEVAVGDLVATGRDFSGGGAASGEACEAGDVVNVAAVGAVIGTAE